MRSFKDKGTKEATSLTSNRGFKSSGHHNPDKSKNKNNTRAVVIKASVRADVKADVVKVATVLKKPFAA